jgi:hypothetical protein
MEDSESLEVVKDAFAYLIKQTQELEDDCGDGIVAQGVKRHLQKERERYRLLLYKVLHGCYPPVALPDNWESSS